MESIVNAGPTALMEIQGLGLRLQGNTILNGVSLRIDSGEIHALVGEHGAGKTSLASVLSGRFLPHGGVLRMNGNSVNLGSPGRAMKEGIIMVSQHVTMAENFIVAENLFLGVQERGLSPLKPFKRRELVRQARDYFDHCGIRLDPERPTAELNLADMALVSILNALYRKPGLIILDETLEKLTSINLIRIVSLLRDLVQHGSSVLHITHRIDDVYEISDRVTILRDGRTLLTEHVDNIDKINLIRLAYTQMNRRDEKPTSFREFDRLLKYNEAILNELPINLLVLDGDNRVKMVNQAAEVFLGALQKSPLDRRIDEVLRGFEDDDHALFIAAIDRRVPETLYDIHFRIGEGNLVGNVILYPVVDGRDPVGLIVIVEDVTERNEMKEQLILSEKLASVGLLAAGVAHEINNPLGIIYNYLDSLKFFSPPEAGYDEILNKIEGQFEYIATIVNNLLSFSNNRRGGTESVSVGDAIEEIIHLIRFNAKAKNIEIEITMMRTLVLQVNETEIKQVILNLLKNSFEAMPEGGKILITAAEESGGAESGDRICRISVRDTGPGIQMENPNDIFLPFRSTKSQTDTHLGLGLSVSYGIIQKMGGSISVRNPTEGGCEFRIELPIAGVHIPTENHNEAP